VQLRKLGSHEVDLHRDLRLRALREAPDSFGETFADAAARSISCWEDLTRSVTEPGRHAPGVRLRNLDTSGPMRGELSSNRSLTPFDLGLRGAEGPAILPVPGRRSIEPWSRTPWTDIDLPGRCIPRAGGVRRAGDSRGGWLPLDPIAAG
jgi:hypothetical protein